MNLIILDFNLAKCTIFSTIFYKIQKIMKKFYLIDGWGFLHRAYFAFPDMPDKDWHNINTIFWFFRIILKIFLEKPDYFVIARDAPTKTHRHEAYPEYKANRAKAPDDFKIQIPIIQEITNRLEIPNIMLPGYEADDIIASIVTKFKQDQDVICNIFSTDKDLKQLLDENITITDSNKWITYKPNDFIQEFWFEPKYMLDYLSLIWDNADNVKWVPWIWPKWANELIQQYKTIENIYENIDWIPWKTKEKLIDWKEFAENAKKLIQLEIAPEIDEIWLEKYKLDIDFNNYKKVLVDEYNFWSMEKVITEIKNKYQMPQQTSLF